ncbi:MAG: 3-oxoacyl-ACP reductase FabG [Planctomycetes bacterium]|nr:3-oxoacyl-ACP reductase FabG [Planctomycetota bacterium]
MSTIDLAGKTAIVTGSGQGLGRCTATTLHAAGANVVINYFADGDGLNRQRAEDTVSALGERAIAVAADVRSVPEINRMIDQTIQQFGRLDIVVNNAAIIRDRTLKKMTDEEWQAVIDTNLTGVFQVCRAAADRIAEEGRIVNMASISGVVGFYGQVNYSAAKAGVIAITKVLSKELARRKITVNAVAPGVVLTEMGKTIPEEVRAGMIAQIPLGRFGEPEEISNVILFLCSDLASYVTGQTIHANGGWLG